MRKQLGAYLDPPSGLSEGQKRARDRLVDAAAVQFTRLGYRRASIGEIASDAGVGKGTVYLYFSRKVELLWACMAREKIQLLPELEQLLGMPPAERLEAYLRLVVRFVLTAPLSAALAAGDRELAAAIADAEAAGLMDDPLRGLAFVEVMVADAAPGIDTETTGVLARVLKSVLSLPANLSTMQQFFDLSDEDFIDTYPRILAGGVVSYSPGGAEEQ